VLWLWNRWGEQVAPDCRAASLAQPTR
jgi:hypothetical protein